jgi:hypothetical protein
VNIDEGSTSTGGCVREIHIHSGLENAILVKGITRADGEGIAGFAVFDQAPITLGMEALAQMAALHLRWRIDFTRHAFLMTLRNCRAESTAPLTGRLDLEGVCEGRTGAVAAYRLQAMRDGEAVMAGSFLIGTLAYGAEFQETRLKEHYRGLWRALNTVSKAG